ncbi:MAG: FAD-dependent oxidoreductase [Candidatus Hodarchaeales archaeon]|jgi:NADPH-dependent glutamate synthase beta subunit-like oxidoreductase/NAD-dependent dihydropyrimidine dehydrogenase PreA subunit
MEKVSLTINSKEISVVKGTSILEAAQTSGIYIPRLCTHPDLPPSQGKKPVEFVYRGDVQYKNDVSASSQEHEGCQLCVVKIEGENELTTSCNKEIEENMTIWTDTSDIHDFRRKKMINILSKHRHACLTCAQQEGCSREPCSTNVPVEERCCPEFGRCELQKLAEYIGIREDTPRYVPQETQVLDDEPLFIRNYELCIGCTRCVRMCQDVRGVESLGFVFSNGETIVGSITPTLKDSGCKFCGACVEVCPTGALSDKDILWSERETALVPCQDTCPLEADVPCYIRHVAEREFDKAVAVIREKTPLPLVLGRICFHTCEEKCRRSQINEPIAICALKRFALEHDKGTWKSKIKIAPATGKKVAIVGSGPAGLTAAYYLAKAGHSLTIFEAESRAGGMMNFGIPEYRLPREILHKDIEHIKDMGVEIRTEEKIGEKITLKDLNIQGEEAIFLAIGAQQAKKLRIEGVNHENVLWGLDFLKKVNLNCDVKVEKRVLVIGGGNVAMDVALTALRLGANEIIITCLESREEMPAHEWEIKEVVDEGIKLNCSWGPKQILVKNGEIAGVELIKCTSVFDSKGAFSPTFDKAITQTIETDMVIIAIGQDTDLSILDKESQVVILPGGYIKINEDSMETNVPGVFAGGEVTEGPISVVDAIKIGRKAAQAIDKYLEGTGNIDEVLTEIETPNAWLGRDEGFYDRQRFEMPTLPISERSNGFTEIELGYLEEMAVEEANRCLRCDLRLQVSQVILPPEKWLELSIESIENVPESEGAFQLLDENKQVIFIQGTLNLRQALEEKLSSVPNACYFGFEKDPMYTKRESELLQQFMQEFGRMPEGNEELDDDLF